MISHSVIITLVVFAEGVLLGFGEPHQISDVKNDTMFVLGVFT